jgi:hypothetical protein
MKKILITVIIASMLGFNTIAYAAEEGTGVDAGITPDSILYPVDKLVEDVQLTLTSDPQKEAELLLDFSQERLAEASQMTEEQKTEYAETAVDGYIETLNQAQEKVAEVAADENTPTEVKENLAEELNTTAEVDENIEASLDTEQQEQLEEKTTEVSYTANVVKNLDAATVKTLREAGMGFGQIAHTIALSQLSGKSVEEISGLIKEGNGIGSIAKELGIHPSKINVKTSKETAQEDSQETPVEEQTENTTGDSSTQTATALAAASETLTQSTISQTADNSTKTTYKKDDKKAAVNVKKESEKTITNTQSKDASVKENSTDNKEVTQSEVTNDGQTKISDTKDDSKSEIKDNGQEKVSDTKAGGNNEAKDTKNDKSNKDNGKGKK